METSKNVALIRSASKIYSDPPLKTVSTFPTTAENKTNIILRYAALCWRKCQRFFYVFTMFVMCVSCMLKSTYHCVQISKQWESSPGTNGSGAYFDLHFKCDFQSCTHVPRSIFDLVMGGQKSNVRKIDKFSTLHAYISKTINLTDLKPSPACSRLILNNIEHCCSLLTKHLWHTVSWK